MSLRLKIRQDADVGEISAQLTLPTDTQTFTMTPIGARQLAHHLHRLADLIDGGGE